MVTLAAVATAVNFATPVSYLGEMFMKSTTAVYKIPYLIDQGASKGVCVVSIGWHVDDVFDRRQQLFFGQFQKRKVDTKAEMFSLATVGILGSMWCIFFLCHWRKGQRVKVFGPGEPSQSNVSAYSPASQNLTEKACLGQTLYLNLQCRKWQIIFHNGDTWSKCYKTFYARKLWIFVLS